MLRLGDLELDEATLEAWHSARPLPLRGKPFGLLARLARDVGRTVTKQQLLADLWPSQVVSEWALTSAVRDVRRALKEVGAAEAIRIESVRGRGYRLSMPGLLATSGRCPDDSPVADAVRTPPQLVGRDAELGRLAAALDDTLNGRSRTVLVTGVAGIGKTRLVEQVDTFASVRGVDVLWGRCQDGQNLPLWPWAEIVRALVRARNPDQLRPILRNAIPELIHALPSLRALAPEVAPPPPSDPDLARLALLDAFIELFERVAASRPCALVVDDVQWADSSSLMLLRSLAQRRSAGGLLVIALYRDDEVEPSHPAATLVRALERADGVERLALGPLTEEHARALLENLGARRAGTPPLEELYRIAGGNPFFLGELSRHLRESIDLRPLPREIELLIGRRLERRTPVSQQVIAAAAVVGMEFHADLLRHLVADEAKSVDDALDELTRAGLIEAPARPGEPHRFAHALTRRTAYARIPASRRARLHLAVAEHLEAAVNGELPAELAERLAEHFDLSMDVSAVPRAFRYHLLAGEDAHRRLSAEDTARHYRRAAALFDGAVPRNEAASPAEAAARDERHCELLIALVIAARKAGDGATTSEAWEAALPLARRLDSPRHLARLLIATPIVSWEDTRAIALHEEAVERLGTEPTLLRAVTLASLAARLRDTRGSRARRQALLDEALAITARNEHPSARFYVLDAFLQAMDHADLLPERLRHATEMRSMADAGGGPWMAAEALAHRHSVLLRQGRLGEALAAVSELSALATRYPWPRVQWLASGARFVAAFADARLTEAEECCLRTGELGLHNQQPTGEIALATQLPTLRLEQARLAETLPMVEAFVVQRPALRWTLDVARAESGDHETLQRLSAELSEGSAMLAHEADSFRVVGLCWLAQACALLDVADPVGIIRTELAPIADTWAVAGTGFYTYGSIRRPLGNLELLQGHPERAVPELTRAVEAHDQPGATLLRLWSVFDLARALRRRASSGDREHAARLLGDAHTDACRLDLTWLRERIEAEGDV